MVGASDASSSSDDEQLKRCQEAVWETPSDKKQGDKGVCSKKRSVVADDHEHDGNELQVTQGFRTHVAKKLGHLLDSYITEMQTETSSCVESAKCDDHDEGFRLFTTSVPGQAAEDAPAPVKRRPIPSSSDSDSEMESRLREAAVSVKDLLPSAVSSTSTECPSGKVKEKTNLAEGVETHAVKKKKRRKQNQEEGADVDSACSAVKTQSSSEHGSSEQEHTQVEVKRKKKKKRKQNTEDEALN
uniref:Protein CUSTOS n=1 Tax=Anabas testudineus TaxID=64144 RepID=A0A3Q1K2M5_ANATE